MPRERPLRPEASRRPKTYACCMDGSEDGFRTRRVQGDGVSLHTVTYGPSEAPTIVLVHGYPDTHVCFREVMRHLGRRFLVVAYDVRGAGGSDAPREESLYRLEHLHRDLRAVIDAVSPSKPVHLV